LVNKHLANGNEVGKNNLSAAVRTRAVLLLLGFFKVFFYILDFQVRHSEACLDSKQGDGITTTAASRGL